MNRLIIQYLSIGMFLFVSVFCSNVQAQPNRPSEKDIQIQKVFIEASKEKLLGNYEDAIFLFTEVLHKDKNNHAAMYELAQLYLLTKKEDKAFNQVKQALNYASDNLWYNLLYADLLEDKGDFPAAAKVFEHLVTLAPEKEDFYFDLAFLLAKSGKYQESIDAFNELEKRIGPDEELTMQKHGIYMAMGKPELAAGEIEKLIRVFPNEIRYLHVLTSHYKSLGDIENVKKTYERILEKDPEDPSANMAMAESFKSDGDHLKYLNSIQSIFANPEVEIDAKVREIVPYIELVARGEDEALTGKAIELTNLITEAHPGDAKAYSLHGDMLYNAGYLQKALTSYRKAVEIEKNVFNLWQQIFLIDSELGKFENLLEDTEAAMDYFPNQPMAYFFNGLGHAQLENHGDAIDMLEQALMMAGNNELLKAEIYVHLGGQYNAVKEFEKSDNAYEEALSINANNAMALNNYSYYLSVRNERLDRAENMAWRANELVPNQSSYQDTLGWVFYKKKQYKEAKSWILKAIENGGDTSPQILENYGDVLYQLNEIDEAVEFWMKALENGSTSELLEKKISDKKLYE